MQSVGCWWQDAVFESEVWCSRQSWFQDAGIDIVFDRRHYELFTKRSFSFNNITCIGIDDKIVPS